MDIPIASPFGYLGVLLFIVGAFLLLSGLNILRVEKITIQAGRTTVILSVVIIFISFVFLFIEYQGTQIKTSTDQIVVALPTEGSDTPSPQLSPSHIFLSTETSFPTEELKPTWTVTPVSTSTLPIATNTVISQTKYFYGSSLDNDFFGIRGEFSGRYFDDPGLIEFTMDPLKLYYRDDKPFKDPVHIAYISLWLEYDTDYGWATVGESNRFRVDKTVLAGEYIDIESAKFKILKDKMANDRVYRLTFDIVNDNNGHYYAHSSNSLVFDYSWNYSGPIQYSAYRNFLASTIEDESFGFSAEINGSYRSDENVFEVEVDGGKISYMNDNKDEQSISLDHIDVHFEYFDVDDNELTRVDNSNLYLLNVNTTSGESLIIAPFTFRLYSQPCYGLTDSCWIVFDIHTSSGEHIYIRSDEIINLHN